MTKKILSIALAVVMLFSTMALAVSAANTTVETTFPADGQIGFRVVTDAYVGMPAGEEVTVKLYWVHPADVDYDSWLQSVGNVAICYNNEAYTYNTDNDGSTSEAYDGRTWGAAYESIFKPAAGVNTGETVTNTVISGLTDADATYGWNDMALVSMVVDTSVTTNAKGFSVDPTCEVFSLSFTTVREITAADVFGIPTSTLAKQTICSYSSGTKQTKLTAANIINNEPAVPATVANSDTATAKMRPNADDASKVDLGITGTVKIDSFDPGKTASGGIYLASNLSAVGVQARVNGVVAAGESTCVYEMNDAGDIQYRAAITGIDAAGLGANIEVRTYITDADGNTYFSNWMYIDAETVHTNAVGNGMTGIA